ncbi:MAG: nucleotidyltransferase domain-containing protein [Candidatus Jordarchaeales archaeon]
MDIVKYLVKEKEEKRKYFENYLEYARKIKEAALKFFGQAEVYVFGSAVEGNYHPTLSDIDIAVVTENLEKEKDLRFKVEVRKSIGDVFEIHMLKPEQWEHYKKFIKKYLPVDQQNPPN